MALDDDVRRSPRKLEDFRDERFLDVTRSIHERAEKGALIPGREKRQHLDRQGDDEEPEEKLVDPGRDRLERPRLTGGDADGERRERGQPERLPNEVTIQILAERPDDLLVRRFAAQK